MRLWHRFLCLIKFHDWKYVSSSARFCKRPGCDVTHWVNDYRWQRLYTTSKGSGCE